jgi:hypothetical protein
MRALLILTMATLLGLAAAFGQAADNSDRTMGRGRGGAPFAWNDKNKDGICDITGRPVGEGPGCGGVARGRGRGRAAGPARRGCFFARSFAGQSQPEAPAAQPEKK